MVCRDLWIQVVFFRFISLRLESYLSQIGFSHDIIVEREEVVIDEKE